MDCRPVIAALSGQGLQSPLLHKSMQPLQIAFCRSLCTRHVFFLCSVSDRLSCDPIAQSACHLETPRPLRPFHPLASEADVLGQLGLGTVLYCSRKDAVCDRD